MISLTALLAVIALCLFYLMRENSRLRNQVVGLRDVVHTSLRRLDDRFDDLSLLFVDLQDAPTPGQVASAEYGLVSLLDELLLQQERHQKAL